MLKHTMTAAALAVVLASPAFAQQPAPNTDKTMKAAPHGTMSNDKSMSKDNDKMSNDKATMDKTATAQPAGFMQQQNASEWRGSKLIGASVYGPDNKSIGDINDVLIGNDGRVTAVVVGVGGFLGVGEKNVALPFKALDVERKADSTSIDKITVSYTKDQLKNAPTFAYYKAGQPTTTGERAHEGAPMASDANGNGKSGSTDSMKK